MHSALSENNWAASIQMETAHMSDPAISLPGIYLRQVLQHARKWLVEGTR